MLRGPENTSSQPLINDLISRRRFLNFLELTALATIGTALGGCDIIEPDSCSARLRFYGKEIGNLVRNNHAGLVIDNPQLAQRITFQAGEFRGQPGLSEGINQHQLVSAVRGTILTSRNQFGSGQGLSREERTELLYLMAYTNQIIDAAKLSREDRHSLTSDQAKAVLILALKKANEVYQAPDGKKCFDI